MGGGYDLTDFEWSIIEPLLPIKLALTPGQAHSGNGAVILLIDLANGVVVLGDKAYDGGRLFRNSISLGTLIPSPRRTWSSAVSIT